MIRKAICSWSPVIAGTLFGVMVTGCGGNDSVEDSSVGSAQLAVIYGADNRNDPYAFSDSAFAERTRQYDVALIRHSTIEMPATGNVVHLNGPMHWISENYCPDVRFAQQIDGAACSGTLIAPDLVLTAAHCVEGPDGCAKFSYVFNYRMKNATELETITTDDVFQCKEIAAYYFEQSRDIAVVRLDRPTGRTPAPVRLSSAPLAVGTKLRLMGHPQGLPLKITDGGRVTSNVVGMDPLLPGHFNANLDSYPASSGSGVFLETGEVVGVFDRGTSVPDIKDGSCYRPASVPDDYSHQSECTHVRSILEGLCRVDHRAELCPCGDTVCSCGNDCGACGDGVCSDYEKASLSCCNDCGCPGGQACAGNACELQIGNANGDDRVDALDLSAISNRISGRNPVPFYPSAADLDGDGAVGSRDLTLMSQYQAGQIDHFPREEVVQVAMGDRHTCALLRGGSVRCWGSNDNGQLGYPHTELLAFAEPASGMRNVNLGGRVQQLVAGNLHTCALLEGGTVRCWGANVSGQLGLGHTRNIGDDEEPSSVPVLSLGGTVTKISAGGSHTCAVLSTGTLRCWGGNWMGQLGYPGNQNVGDDELPQTAGDVFVAGRVANVSAGDQHTCALLTDGSVRCWGFNMSGQLGYGGGAAGNRPGDRAALSLGGAAAQIVAGNGNTCAILSDGAVRCWGNNNQEQLGWSFSQFGGNWGDGAGEHPSAAPPLNLGGPATSLAIGSEHVCATVGVGVHCWGGSSSGQLGYANTETVGDPSYIVPHYTAMASVWARGKRTCALSQNGKLHCWGANDYAQLGFGHRRNIGDDEPVAYFGTVPVVPAPRSPEEWHFVNYYNLEVWMRDDGSGPNRTAARLYVRNLSRGGLEGFKVRYLLNTRENPNQPVVVDDYYTPSATPSIINERTSYLKSWELDFSGITLNAGQVTSQGTAGGEQCALHFADWSLSWDTSNDYSATGTPSGQWYTTKRVQILNTQGEVIFGWVR